MSKAPELQFKYASANTPCFSDLVKSKCSALCQDTKFARPSEVEQLHDSVLGRLTSGLTESLLCDILTLYDQHTLLNFECMDHESQAKMAALLQRYFKDVEILATKADQGARGLDPAEHAYRKVDIILFFYLDYMNPQHALIDRRVNLHEGVISTLGDIILQRMKSDQELFKTILSPRALGESLSACIEYQMMHQQGTDSAAVKVLYRMLYNSITQSDQIFESFADRRDFLNKTIIDPLNEIGVAIQNPTNDSQSEVLKKAKILFKIALVWVSKTATCRNKHVFTLNVLDNEHFVRLIQIYSEFQIEQYSSLFERFSRSPKSMKLNLEIYSMICKFVSCLIDCMAQLFRFPKDETTKCLVFSQTMPGFLIVMTEQLNVFVMTRGNEMHKFTDQLVLVYDFLHFFSSVITYSQDEKLSELFHAFSTGFMPQTIFFLAQYTNLYDQERSDQLREQFHLWNKILAQQMKTQKPLKSEMTEQDLIDQINNFDRLSRSHNEQSLLSKPKVTRQGTKVNVLEEEKKEEEAAQLLHSEQYMTLRTRIQKESLILIAQFCMKIPDSAHFISSYLRELMVCVLNTQKERTFVPPDELNHAISKHTFLNHFSSTVVLHASIVHPTQQIYLCLELINLIYPVLLKMGTGYQAQLNILHETLFVLTDFEGGSQKNQLIDMLLLLTFSQLRNNLFRVEFKKRLSKVLATILKPKTIEDCQGLNTHIRGIMNHIKTECLQFMAPDLIKTCATLLKASTRVLEPSAFDLQTEHEDENLSPIERACEFPRLLKVVLKEWLRIKKDKDCTLLPKQRNLPIAVLTKELVERFLEVIGVRKDPLQFKGKTSLFGFNNAKSDALDWSVEERPKSELALELLELLRICLKDLAAPDYKPDTYTKIEIQVQPLLDNLTAAPMKPYKQEVNHLVNVMIVVCREITPTLNEILDGIIAQAEAHNTVFSTKTLALFMSHGTSFFEKNIPLYETLARILQNQLSKYANDEILEQVRRSQQSRYSRVTDNPAESLASEEVDNDIIQHDMTHTEVLIATQMLFLNNFCELLCQQVNETLICLFKCIVVPQKGDIIVAGISPENKEMMALVKKHIVLAISAMFYNHGQVVVEFFQEHLGHFKSFLQMVHSLLPLELEQYCRFSTYEVKLLVCGLSRAFFRTSWNDLPFHSVEHFQDEVRGMANRIGNCLYWLKLQEDGQIYFQNSIMQKRADKIERKLKLQKANDDGNQDEEAELRFDDEEEQEVQLIDYLLQFYLKLTPDILDEQYQLNVEQNDKLHQSQLDRRLQMERFQKKMAHQLTNVDEFVNFKKYFVLAHNNDRGLIQEFLNQNVEFKELAEFVFRCRRIRFSTDSHQEQIRLIYNFQL